MVNNIIAGIIATLICSFFLKLFDSFKKRKTKKYPKNVRFSLRELKIIKKQFYGFLIYLFIAVFGLIFNPYSSDILLITISVTVFFTFIVIWGAFDAVYLFARNILKESDNHIPYKDTDSDK